MLKEFMKKLELNQTEAAKKLGVSQSQISDWLAGKREIPGPVKKLIERLSYEHYKNKVRGGIDMEQAIERLKKQNEESLNTYYEDGKKEGFRWAAEDAHIDELRYAVNYDGVGDFDMLGFMQEYFPTRNDILGEYFSAVMESDEILEKDGSVWEEWERGWIDGVNDFWAEIEDKI